MKYIGRTTVVIYFVFSVISAFSQQVNTTYFMENVPERNILNPAFQPLTDYYIGLPAIGYTQIGLGNNSVTLKDFIYNQNRDLNKNGKEERIYFMKKK